MAKSAAKVVQLSDPTNGADEIIGYSEPYQVHVAIEGVADLLLHRWNVESVNEKSKAAKNSSAKKSDNIESYVYRNDLGEICLPGEYLRMSIVNAAKFRQDPRSPRKSAMDLYKAGVICTTMLASLGVKEWHYLDTRRAVVQRQGINRTRLAMRVGWKAEYDFIINVPEYISRNDFRSVLEVAGRLIGVGDFRPTYGRFGISSFE
jgi:hypothetical protein